MPMSVLKDIRKIYAGLNAHEVRSAAVQDLRIGLLASSESVFRDMEDFLVPPHLDAAARGQALRMVYRLEKPHKEFDFILCEPGIGLPRNGFLFDPAGSAAADESMIESVVEENQAIELALGRSFPIFRTAVAHRIVTRVARENALLALATALPNVIPGVIELPWAVGEFATDTAFLTMNQVRMALMLAAVYDLPVGYAEQKASIAAIAAGAFGWRAIARELVGKIPLGGGLIPKAAVAYAGTWVVGNGIDRLYRTGVNLSRREKRETWKRALAEGREVATELRP
jgi:hypothetical protein